MASPECSSGVANANWNVISHNIANACSKKRAFSVWRLVLRNRLLPTISCTNHASMKFITRQAMNVAKLLTVSAPDKLVAELAAYKARDPACGIASVHMYPLGGLKKSADWSYAVADGRFDWNRNGDGFEVHAST